MLEWVRGATLVAATITAGLMAGLLYAYACSVMIGLSRTDDRTFVDVMQRINLAIVNGWFFVTFFGALVFTAAAGDPDRITDLAAVRERFEATWVRWNIARAVASTAALGCLSWALVLYGRLVQP